MSSKTKSRLILLAILALGTIVRFYHLHSIFFFGVDEEYQANLAFSLLKDFHVLWIGVGSTIGFYLGPLWTYITYGLFVMSGGRPLILGYAAGALGVVTLATLFLVVRDVFNQKAAVIASLLYACLPLIVYYDQKFWNVSAVPLVSILIFYSLAKLSQGNRYLYLLAFLTGIMFHVHLSLVPLVVLSGVIVISNLKHFKFINVLIAGGIFLSVYSPLVVFDYYHKWSNLLTPVRASTTIAPKTNYVGVHAKVLFQALGRVWYLPPHQNNADEINWGCTSSGNVLPTTPQKDLAYWMAVDKITTRSAPVILLSVFSIGLVLSFVVTRETYVTKERRLVLAVILVQVLGFLVFPGKAFEYYLLGFFPMVLLVFALVFPKKYVWWLTLPLCVLGVVTVLTTQPDFGLAAKEQLIHQTLQVVGDRNFELVESGMCQVAGGWRYLFSRYGKPPVASSVDKSMGWIYPDELTTTPPEELVVVEETRIPENYKLKVDKDVLNQVISGGYTATIYTY